MPTTEAADPSSMFMAMPCLSRAPAASEAFFAAAQKTVVVVLIAVELCGLRSVIDARANRFLEP